MKRLHREQIGPRALRDFRIDESQCFSEDLKFCESDFLGEWYK